MTKNDIGVYTIGHCTTMVALLMYNGLVTLLLYNGCTTMVLYLIHI